MYVLQAGAVLSQCTTVLLPCGSIVPLSSRMKASLLAKVDSLAGEQALRCLALASKQSELMGALATYDGDHHSAHARCVFEYSLVLGLGLRGLRSRPEYRYRQSRV